MTSRAALDALRPEWDALWSSVPDSTPFQHSAWICAWCDAFDPGELRVTAFRHCGRLCGLALLYLTRSATGSGELRLLGTGVSDYLDVLVAPDMAPRVVRALESTLEQSTHEWTRCTFDHLRPGSLLLDVRPPDDMIDTREPDEPCPTLLLPTTREALSAAIGSRMSRNIRQQWHRAERLGRVAVRHEQSHTLESTLDALFRLHAKRWNAKGSPGVLADPQVRDFHCHAAEGLLRAGVLRLYSLWIGAQVAAVHYGFHTLSGDYFYIGGFDPSFSSIGAGSLTIAAALDRAIAERSFVFDFLGGREPYKYEWGAVDRARVNRHLQRREAERN